MGQRSQSIYARRGVISNRDLAPDLDDPIVRQFEGVAEPRGVSAHRREEGDLPARQALADFTRHDGFVANIEGNVVEIDLSPLRLALRENVVDVGRFHEAKPRLGSPEIVGLAGSG